MFDRNESRCMTAAGIKAVSELKQIAWKPCAARLITSFSPPVIKSRSPFARQLLQPETVVVAKITGIQEPHL